MATAPRRARDCTARASTPCLLQQENVARCLRSAPDSAITLGSAGRRKGCRPGGSPELTRQMPKHAVSLDDKYALDETHQILTGTQAIVRLMLTQRARDVRAGLHTAGYVTGYRGSPIASLEAAMLRARGILEANHVRFMV